MILNISGYFMAGAGGGEPSRTETAKPLTPRKKKVKKKTTAKKRKVTRKKTKKKK